MLLLFMVPSILIPVIPSPPITNHLGPPNLRRALRLVRNLDTNSTAHFDEERRGLFSVGCSSRPAPNLKQRELGNASLERWSGLLLRALLASNESLDVKKSPIFPASLEEIQEPNSDYLYVVGH
jgi:hypothetical protein